jgi:hypothetical protein
VPKGLRQKLFAKVFRQVGADTSARPQPMKTSTRALLKARFGAQNTELAALTGLDLSDWKR